MLIALLGIAVLVVAIVALRHPKRSATSAGTDTRVTTPVVSGQPTRGTSPKTSRPRSSPASSTASSTASSATPSDASSPGRGSSGSSGNSAIGSKPLVVLNQTTTSGLADQAANRFRQGGWTVTDAQDGYTNDVLSTTAYYDPDIAGARRAARALAHEYPGVITRVIERFAELPAGPVVVVLTTDYSSS